MLLFDYTHTFLLYVNDKTVFFSRLLLVNFFVYVYSAWQIVFVLPRKPVRKMFGVEVSAISLTIVYILIVLLFTLAFITIAVADRLYN